MASLSLTALALSSLALLPAAEAAYTSTYSNTSSRRLSGGAIAGVVIGAIVLIVVLVVIFFFIRRRRVQRFDQGGTTNQAPIGGYGPTNQGAGGSGPPLNPGYGMTTTGVAPGPDSLPSNPTPQQEMEHKYGYDALGPKSHQNGNTHGGAGGQPTYEHYAGPPSTSTGPMMSANSGYNSPSPSHQNGGGYQPPSGPPPQQYQNPSRPPPQQQYQAPSGPPPQQYQAYNGQQQYQAYNPGQGSYGNFQAHEMGNGPTPQNTGPQGQHHGAAEGYYGGR